MATALEASPSPSSLGSTNLLAVALDMLVKLRRTSATVIEQWLKSLFPRNSYVNSCPLHVRMCTCVHVHLLSSAGSCVGFCLPPDMAEKHQHITMFQLGKSIPRLRAAWSLRPAATHRHQQFMNKDLLQLPCSICSGRLQACQVQLVPALPCRSLLWAGGYVS